MIILKNRSRLLSRAVLSGRSRDVALDVVRRWEDGRAHKAAACGLYGGPSPDSRGGSTHS